MKTSFVITLAAALAATMVSGSPTARAQDADAALAALEKRAACYYPSGCSWLGAATCEHHCRRHGAKGYETVRVLRMEKCSWKNDKRCCCSR
jgi:hypothetical protein